MMQFGICANRQCTDLVLSGVGLTWTTAGKRGHGFVVR